MQGKEELFIENIRKRELADIYNKNYSRWLEIALQLWKKRSKEFDSIRQMLKGELLSFELMRDETIVKLNDGRKYYWDTNAFFSLQDLIANGTWDKAESNILRKLIKPGDCVFDVGANFGWYTILFSLLIGTKGSVHSFEPVPSTFEELKRNVILNSCDNVVLNNSAISNIEGSGKIYLDSTKYNMGACMGASLKNTSENDCVSFTCMIQTLDSYAKQNVKKINLIKIDVEGSELLLLKGATSVLKQKPILMMEIADSLTRKFNYSTNELLAILAEYEYQFFGIDGTKLRRVYSSDEVTSNSNNFYPNLVCFDSNHCNEYSDLIINT